MDGVTMWVPTEDEAVEMFARHFEALHRSGAVMRAKEKAEFLKQTGDVEGHRVWNKVAEVVDRLRRYQKAA